MTIEAAFNFLTLSDIDKELDAGPAGIGIICFPLAGLIMGFVLIAVNRLFEPYLPSEILALLLLAVLILATAGRHLAGTQKTFSASGRKIPAPNSDRLQIHGLVAVLLILLFKSRAMEVVGEGRALSLLVTPLLARWSLVIFLFGATPATSDAGARIAQRVRSWHVIFASVASVGFALFIAGEHTLWIALALSVIALLMRGYLQRRRGGISLANCGALIDIGEALGFTLSASL
jgi:adenosylcobinamide-GDP ribazoletransferase